MHAMVRWECSQWKECSREKAGGARRVVMARASHARVGNDARYCVWACNRSLSSRPIVRYNRQVHTVSTQGGVYETCEVATRVWIPAE